MTCHHKSGDPNCTQTQSRETRGTYTRTPDIEKYKIIQAKQVGPHLVLKVLYPNCSKCAYEGHKVIVFLDVTTEEAIIWNKIDPHFRPVDALGPKAAPRPAARFPSDEEGWRDALFYAKYKQQ
jgi:hypothetical protein